MVSWEDYYKKNDGRPLRPLYTRALTFLPPTAGRGVDLGCGSGIEALDLLQRGFEVHALDQEASSIERLRANPTPNSAKLHLHLSSLENWTKWPATDLLFAYHSLPFCSPTSFDAVFERALNSVTRTGIFAVSFFGPQDDWVKAGSVTGISPETVKNRLQNFEILSFEETRKKGPTALQGDKMWDIIEVIARAR